MSDDNEEIHSSITKSDDVLWIALQICDSSFPGGAFAHSLGLESALHHKLVTDAAGTLDLFVSQTLEQACDQLIPLVCAGYDAYSIIAAAPQIHRSQFAELMLVDSICHISLTNEVARRSSVSQGKCLLRAAREAFSSTSLGMIALTEAIDNRSDIERQQSSTARIELNKPHSISVNGSSTVLKDKNIVDSDVFHCNYAPLFGAICAVLNVPKNLTRRMFLRCMVRDIFSAAARLNIMGPLEGAKKQKEFSIIVEKLLKKTVENDKNIIKGGNCTDQFHERFNYIPDNLANQSGLKRKLVEPVMTSPILEILQARHDVLYARLFNS